MSLTVTVLGCGNSTGVPAIGNYWGQCDSLEPRNRRTRSSIHLRTGDVSVVIDTGPDFRAQINRENIDQVDAVFYTHAHSDHVNGIDELRVVRFRNDALVPIYGNTATVEDLRTRFDYMFSGGVSDIYPAMVVPYVFSDDDYGAELSFRELGFVPFRQDHGTVETVGYRFGDFAYSVDMLDLDERALEVLSGVECWMVDCAGYGHSANPVHANLEAVTRLNDVIGARDVYLTSLSLGADYQSLIHDLPAGFYPAYDGLKLSFP